MKPRTFTAGRIVLATIAVGMTLALVSWDYQQGSDRFFAGQTDTVPQKLKEKKIRDLDDVIDEINGVKFDKDLKEELERAHKQIDNAMKQLDGEKLKLDIEKTMKDVDMGKIKEQMDKAKLEMEKAFKDMDMSKIKMDMEQSMAKVNWDEMKKELEKVKEMNMDNLKLDMEKLKDQMKELGPNLDKQMGNLKIEMEKLKEEMQEYKSFVNGLESDGLINKKEPYTIKHKDGELIINGKKAPEATYNKYRSFLEKHKEFKIDKSDDDFNIDIDHD